MEITTQDEYTKAGWRAFSDLVARGWTDHMKRTLLGKPDKMVRINTGPNYHNGEKFIKVRWPNKGLWRIEKVVAAEALPEWTKMKDKAAVRKQMYRPPNPGPTFSLDFHWSREVKGWSKNR